jgi:hypothetical protein
MKTKIGILLVTICFSTVAFAQKPKERKEFSPEQMALKQAEMLKTRLQLNETQKKKVYELNLKYNKENKMLMEQMQELRKKMQELNQNKEAELKGMLTPEQNAAYDMWKQDRKREMKKNFKTEKRPGTAQPRK